MLASASGLAAVVLDTEVTSLAEEVDATAWASGGSGVWVALRLTVELLRESGRGGDGGRSLM